ncbi:hypothetical protein B0T26DRAFT_673292 [Lasiosphaeria miniovina]|uniref:Zn(2)-C6 fungal-type domain-containing protein n=1 Tax=Lasiosphaeria miniovina TaxID=1954250 RepID=A0AA40B6Y4_9PEZI|nr:uncharacterized protein B0T26DRAFT_673292 [Lasiosphaeria miniovina]KAK0728817.1 hypothetical protein B0T26DRAFT_673292 [Lasiosphaeria miniovina]
MAAPPPMRQSCDRCHGQKLRCERSGNSDTGACNRCIRQGSQCVYSTSLPKGRPSLFGGDQSSAPDASTNPSAKRRAQTPVAPDLRRRPASGQRANSLSAGASTGTTAGPPRGGASPHAHASIQANTQTRAQPGARANTGSSAGGNPAPITGISACTSEQMLPCSATDWPWPGLLNWADLQLDSGGQPLNDLGDWSAIGLHSPVSQVHVNDTALDYFPAQHAQPPDWTAATTTKDGELTLQTGGGGPPPPSRIALDPRLGLTCHVFESPSSGCSQSGTNSSSNHRSRNSTSNRRSRNSAAISADESDLSPGIAQLTQLSTRLYLLHRSSQVLADTTAPLEHPSSSHRTDAELGRAQHQQDPVVDMAAFRLILTRLLSHGFGSDTSLCGRNPDTREIPTISDTLQDTFSASHQLIEILHCLQERSRPRSSMSRYPPLTPLLTPAGPGNSFNQPRSGHSAGSAGLSAEKSPVEQAMPSSSSSRTGHYSNTVARHLVMACHGMLLSIYVALLGVLQQDAELISSDGYLHGHGDGYLHGHGDGLEAATQANTPQPTVPAAGALTDMRLVMIVQLCCYLIKRQQQAVDSYLGPREPSAAGSDPATLSAPDLPPSDLEGELQQRLAQLRQTLRI